MTAVVWFAIGVVVGWMVGGRRGARRVDHRWAPGLSREQRYRLSMRDEL